jgi:hypothetical protein
MGFLTMLLVKKGSLASLGMTRSTLGMTRSTLGMTRSTLGMA